MLGAGFISVCLETRWMGHFAGDFMSRGGVGGKPKIVAKPDPSVSNSAWESIFQMNVGLHFIT